MKGRRIVMCIDTYTNIVERFRAEGEVCLNHYKKCELKEIYKDIYGFEPSSSLCTSKVKLKEEIIKFIRNVEIAYESKTLVSRIRAIEEDEITIATVGIDRVIEDLESDRQALKDSSLEKIAYGEIVNELIGRVSMVRNYTDTYTDACII